MLRNIKIGVFGFFRGSSAKFGTVSPAHRRYGGHGPDAGPSGLPVPPAPTPDVGVAVSVPVVDGSRDRLLDPLPCLEEAPLDRQGLERLPPGLDQVEVGGV